jgi:transcription antitermination factor NusG
MAFWSVAQTEPQREAVAVHFLGEQGFDTYLPVIKAQRRLLPLFPSYVFVQIESAWWAITRTIGVLRVLTNGDHPAELRDDVIAKIRAQEKNGIVKLPTPRPRFVIGDKVSVIAGSFLGQIGIYDGMAGKARERVLLDLLGRQVRVELAKNAIEPIQRIAVS